MATKTKPARPAHAAPAEDDQITTAKLFRSENNALALIARVEGISQPEALRRFAGEALAAGAAQCAEKARKKFATRGA
jgi:hypothetical protein